MSRYFGCHCVYLSDRRGQGISSCQDHLFLLWGLSPQLPSKEKQSKNEKCHTTCLYQISKPLCKDYA